MSKIKDTLDKNDKNFTNFTNLYLPYIYTQYENENVYYEKFNINEITKYKYAILLYLHIIKIDNTVTIEMMLTIINDVLFVFD